MLVSMRCTGAHAVGLPSCFAFCEKLRLACAFHAVTLDFAQWCPSSQCQNANTCWIGSMANCQNGPGWQSRGRNATNPVPNGNCTDPGCAPGTNDAGWRVVTLPHDFVVEGNFSQAADMAHGYLPYGKAWYRKHITFPAAAQSANTIWLDFEAIQTTSVVYLNGELLGSHMFGYTPSRYFLQPSQINWSGDNVLAVFVDATHPDSWWYDGGGIYRHVWLTVVTSPGPFIAPWGLYVPSSVQGSIAWSADGTPIGNGVVTPSVEVWSNSSAVQTFSATLLLKDASGNVVGSASGSGSVASGAKAVWQPSPLSIPSASLWHLVNPPNMPSLYTATVELSVGGECALPPLLTWFTSPECALFVVRCACAGVVVDATTVTFGIRRTAFNAATGFYLNDVPTKITGTANHQDTAAVGVAVPDHLQAWRVAKLKEMVCGCVRIVAGIVSRATYRLWCVISLWLVLRA